MAQDPRARADRRAALAALITAAVMIAQQVGSKATRDALFLSSFDAQDLPRVVIAAAAASMVAVIAASRAYARFGPARVVPVAFGVSAVLYFIEWSVADSMSKPVAVVLYIHTALFGALVISGFWSVVNERFDPHTAKKVVGRIGTGATFGGVAGGLLAERVGSMFEASTMLLALGILNLVAGSGVFFIDTEKRTGPPPEPAGNGISVLRKTPYLQMLAGLVLLTAMSAALLDYAFKAEAADHFSQAPGDLLQFFAIFHVAAAVLSLLVQLGFARVALEQLRPAGSAALLPTIVVLTASVGAAITNLATVVLTRASELVIANSIFRSGYELLYTPVALEKKRPTKTLIDVAGNRLGDAIGSGFILLILALVPIVLSTKVVLGLGAVFALASLVIARRLHNGYVSQLSLSLSSGAPKGAEAAMLQAATLQTLSTLGLDREALFEQIAANKSYRDRVSHSTFDGKDESLVPPPFDDGIDAPADDPIHELALTLRQGTAEEIRAALETESLDVRVVPFVIALLARRDVYHNAVLALRTVADEAVEPMVAALTDIDQPFAIRRRLPRVLQLCDTEAGSAGLARGLDDDKFEVRYRCAIALARIAARIDAHRPDPERIYERVKYELSRSRRTWDKGRRLLDDDEDDPTPLLEQKADRDRIHRSVEHVFTMLSLVFDPQAVRLALFAVSGDDRALRGTALEYLENVLPDEIREALFPMLDARIEIARKRSQGEIVADLVRSFQAMDAEELRKAIESQKKDD